MKESVKKQLVRLLVSRANEVVETSPNDKTDENYDNVDSYILFVPTNAEKKSTLHLKIDGYEIEPEKYPVEGCITNTGVAPDLRMKKVPFATTAKGSKIHLEYTDGGSSPYYPYTVVLALKLSQNKPQI